MAINSCRWGLLVARHDEVVEVPGEVALDAHTELLKLLLELDRRPDWPDGRAVELVSCNQHGGRATRENVRKNVAGTSG